MGRGPRSNQAIGGLSPRRQKPPTEVGQKKYRHRLAYENGKVREGGGLGRDALSIFKGSGVGWWEIVESTALRGERGDLVWVDKIVSNFDRRQYTSSWAKGISQIMNEQPEGHYSKEEISPEGDIILSHMQRGIRYNDRNSFGGYRDKRDGGIKDWEITRFCCKAGDQQDAKKMYGKIKDEVAAANIEQTQQAQDKYLFDLAREKDFRTSSKLLQTIESDYLGATEKAKRNSEAWEQQQLKNELQKNDPKKQSKRTQSTIKDLSGL